MKKLILLLFTIVSFTSFSQQIENNWNTDINKSIQISQNTGKPLMLFFTGSDWCGWCKKLVREVYKTSEFHKWAKKNVVLVEIDFNTPFRTRIKLAQKGKVKLTDHENEMINLSNTFGVRGYPTVYFVKAVKGKDGKIQLKTLGQTGYVAGGPTKWISTATQQLQKK